MKGSESVLPTEYEIQKIAVLRGLIQDEERIQNFRRFEAGVKGEDKFHQYLLEFGLGHWVILRNRWFHDNSPFECDLILITSHAIYVFEVKNYYGKFIYENGQCSSRGVQITYNPVNQARNATIHLRNILRQYTVKGALIFIGEHNQVEIKDVIDYLDILECNEVYQYIQTIVAEERQHTGYRIKADEVIAHLEQFKIDPPYLTKPYTRKEMANVQPGVFCANCQQKVWMKRGQYIRCTCGLRESKEEAIIRTACEYGVLTYSRDFTVRDIYDFVGGETSIDYVRKVLLKHFETVPGTAVLTFKNLIHEYALLAGLFHIERPKMMVYY